MTNICKFGVLFITLAGCQNITQQQYDWAIQNNVKLREEVSVLKKQAGSCTVLEKEVVKSNEKETSRPITDSSEAVKKGEPSIQSEGAEEVAAHLNAEATSAEARLDAAVDNFDKTQTSISQEISDCLKWITSETFDPPLNSNTSSKLCSNSSAFVLEKKDLNYIACVDRFIASPINFYWGDIETDCLKDSNSVPPPPPSK